MVWRRTNDLTRAGEPIAGLCLYPPTIGHCLVLADVGIDLFAVESVPDMLMACFVLAHADHAEAERDLCRWWTAGFLRLFSWLFVRRFNAADEAEKFAAYLKENNETPDVIIKNGSRRGSGTPWVWRLYAAAVAECGLSRAEAMALPIQEAQLLTAALGEMRGNVELWTDRDEAFWRACEEADKAKGLT